MLYKKIDANMRIVLGPDCMRILQCKPGDEVDISMMYESDSSCHTLVIKKAETITPDYSLDKEKDKTINKEETNGGHN